MEQDTRHVDDMHKARMFRPRQLSDWLDLILKTAAAGVILMSMAGTVIRVLAPEWYEVPGKVEELGDNFESVSDDLEVLSSELGALRQELQDRTPVLLDFKGSMIVARPEVKAGESITVAMVVRRNVSCETIVRVRFYDHATNTISQRHTYDVPAQKAPVSERFQPFPIQVFIPFDIPPGRYSYFPEIIPIDCGVYGPLVPPMSLPFDVVA